MTMSKTQTKERIKTFSFIDIIFRSQYFVKTKKQILNDPTEFSSDWHYFLSIFLSFDSKLSTPFDLVNLEKKKWQKKTKEKQAFFSQFLSLADW